MSIVTINLGNKQFKLSCPEEGKNNLIALSDKLDFELSKVRKLNSSASFELSLVMTALGLLHDKQLKNEETAGSILSEANQDFETQLSSIFSELKIVANKLQKC